GGFDSIAKVNKKIEQEEKKIKEVNSIDNSKTEEIDLTRLNIKEFSKDLKKQKSLALKESTITRLNKLSKIYNTSVSEIVDKILREALELK
ncbi:MAG: hypothetical protein K4H23_03680, partial [Mollicutes bacterium PWAP]|nr:hypothetical protein [Mollicutes bacterium PWAP]